MKTAVIRKILPLGIFLAMALTPTTGRAAQDPWSFLEGFQPLPSSLTQFTDRYVAVLYVKRDEQLVAAVFFNASCSLSKCELLHRAGFAAIHAAGSSGRVYVEPDDREILDILAAIAARYALNA